MTDYASELAEALRCCIQNPPETCVGCTYNIGNNECNVKRMIGDAAAAIEELQVRLPKRGKWERELDVHDEPFYQCSVCGECFDSNRDSTHEVFKYCPDCGAKMEVQE